MRTSCYRILWILLAVGLITINSSGNANADAGNPRPFIPGEQRISNSAAVVHYAPGYERDANSVLQQVTSSLQRISTELQFTVMPDDRISDPTGDPRLDAYVLPDGMEFGGRGTRGGAVQGGIGSDAGSGFFYLFGSSTNNHNVTHELFHSFQQAIDAWEEAAPSGWWMEITAEWAAFTLGPTSSSLRRYGVGWSVFGMICTDDPVEGCYDHTYAWWPFAEYLSARFGVSIIHEIWVRQGELGRGNYQNHASQAIQSVLQAHGTNLREIFTAFAAENAYPRYGLFSSDSPYASEGHVAMMTDMAPQSLDGTYNIEPWAIRYVTMHVGPKGGSVTVSGAGAGDAAVRVLHTATGEIESVASNSTGSTTSFQLPAGLMPNDTETVVLPNTSYNPVTSQVSFPPQLTAMTRVSATPQVTQSTQPVPIGKKTPAPRLVLLVRSARLRHGKLVVRGVCSKGIRGKFITVRYISSSPPKKVRKRLKCKAFTWKAVLRVGKSRGGKITVEYHDPNGRGTTAVKHVTKK